MKKKIWAICDAEAEYLRRLTEYLDKKARQAVQICSFTDIRRLKEFLEKEEIALLLISESMYRKELIKEHIKLSGVQTMVLNESGNTAGETVKNISKFQPSEHVFREIMDGYAKAEEPCGVMLHTGQMKILGNYSPVRRCLQTTFSLCMGQLLARKHRVLYLNFESYSGFSYMLNREFTADMSDVLYFFQCGKDSLARRLEGTVASVNGLDFIPPALSYHDLNTVTGQQWVKLFWEIEQAAGYEYLILDLSEQIQGLFDILRECHKVYTITGRDSFADAKMKQYETLLLLDEYESVRAKTRKCGLPVFRRLPGGLEQLTHGDLAAYVEKIIEEDMDGITGQLKNKTEGTDHSTA